MNFRNLTDKQAEVLGQNSEGFYSNVIRLFLVRVVK